MSISANLIEFAPSNHRVCASIYEARYGILYKFAKPLYDTKNRISGNFSKVDQLQLACCCEPPMYFLLHGVMIPHAYGITLSVDEIGADCMIGQNVTLGTNARGMKAGEHTTGYKPMLGHHVICYAGSVISGHINIGDNVIIAANAFVDKDVPDNSIVYGVNIIKPLKEHHKQLLKLILWECINSYKLEPGLVYKNERLYIDEEYRSIRPNPIERVRFRKFYAHIFSNVTKKKAEI